MTVAGVEDVRLRALQAAAQVVGADRVSVPDGPLTLGPNISLYRSREVGGVVAPRTAEEARQVVEIFGRSKESGGLHAFSTGRNWGLGSREPALDDAVVLDLGGLDRVRDLDVGQGWAVVEPGVTQAVLSELLAGTSRMLNVTVSSAHTSVVGNTLDRGVGLRHQRVNDLLGLEVVLPSGELLRVGWWPEAERATPVYPYGLGPSVLQTFVQSNLGVVTAAVVKLLPRPEALRVVRLNFEAAALPEAIDALRRWEAQGLASGVIKVYNPAAAQAYGGPAGQYLAHVCVDGTAAKVDALTKIILEEARAGGLFTEASDSDAADPTKPNHAMARRVELAYAGDPDVSDALFEAKLGNPAAKLDETNGFLFFLPLVPFSGDAIAEATRLLEQVSAETGIGCGATLNALGPDVIDCVVAMKFDRTTENAERAHRALDRLYELFAAAGFTAYRLDVDHTAWIDPLSPDAPTREFVRRLKDFVDPNHAIAPGRYH